MFRARHGIILSCGRPLDIHIDGKYIWIVFEKLLRRVLRVHKHRILSHGLVRGWKRLLIVRHYRYTSIVRNWPSSTLTNI